MKIPVNEKKNQQRESLEGIIRDCEYRIKHETLRKAIAEQALADLDKIEADENPKLVGGRPR